jgi:hypothetical protein
MEDLMEDENTLKTIIRFDQAAVQADGTIKRIMGFVEAKNMLSLFDDTTLDANPRSAKANAVTADIIESLSNDPATFQFKTKGILLGTSDYKELQRNRYELRFVNPAYEGLLDGGHNMLAIGTFLLLSVMAEKDVRKIKLWEEFKVAWKMHSKAVRAKREQFTFKVPVELLVPADVDNEQVVQSFTMTLMDVCAARNNNAQLTTEAKANQRGFYDEIKKRLPEELSNRIEWKSNEWEDGSAKPIKVRDIVALGWIPLGVLNDAGCLPKISDTGVALNFSVLPQNIYRNKGELSKLFDRLMEHSEVSKQTQSPVHELHNAAIGSAFDILAQLPFLYDKIFLDLGVAYNKGAGGKFGLIKAVKYKEGKEVFLSPFFARPSEYGTPDGFVMPVFFGLKALIKVEGGKLLWKTDPASFLDRNIKKLAGAFRMPMEMAGFDPQKVAKNETSYSFMVGEFEKALIQETHKL